MALIDREALAQNAQTHLVEYGEYMGEDVREVKMVLLSRVMSAPIVDAVPVVHGRWFENRKGYLECSVCHADRIGIPLIQNMNYCHNCGAKMDKED